MKKLKILSLICCLLVICLITGCGNSNVDDSKKYNIEINEISGVDIKAYIPDGGKQVIVTATNNSGEMIGSGYIKVNYYDENNNEIQVNLFDDTRYNMFENGKEIVCGFDLPYKDLEYYVPAKTVIEMTIDEEYAKDYEVIMSRFEEHFEYSYTKNTDSITLAVKNNHTEMDFLPRNIAVVFYKNNKPVYSYDAGFLMGTINAGQTKTKEINMPKDYKKSKEAGENILMDFDDVKIFRVLEGTS